MQLLGLQDDLLVFLGQSFCVRALTVRTFLFWTQHYATSHRAL